MILKISRIPRYENNQFVILLPLDFLQTLVVEDLWRGYVTAYTAGSAQHFLLGWNESMWAIQTEQYLYSEINKILNLIMRDRKGSS